jgi:hypothetical protein
MTGNGLDSCGPGREQAASCCGHVDEHLASIRCWVYHKGLRNVSLLGRILYHKVVS